MVCRTWCALLLMTNRDLWRRLGGDERITMVMQLKFVEVNAVVHREKTRTPSAGSGQ